MLTIRPIAADELSAFLALQPDPERAADQAAYIDRMFAAGAMRPEWCYVATDGDATVGRFAFWSLPKLDVPISLVLVDVAGSIDGTRARDAIADALLQRAVEDALCGLARGVRLRPGRAGATTAVAARPGRARRLAGTRGVRGRPIDLALVVRRPAARGARPPHIPDVRRGRGGRVSRRARGGLQLDA